MKFCTVPGCERVMLGGDYCNWHGYRDGLLKMYTDVLRRHEANGILSRTEELKRKIEKYSREMSQPAPSAKPSKSAVRDAVNLFLQAPGLATVHDAKEAIDRYMREWNKP